ncbi:cytoskeleton protein RodZ [Vibrio profundum]|uniref:cytoskeleton protein RodZ n=1 Tax=Vibrio profundum TaxID=2910247 RepID=UPI003D127201
MSTKQNILVEEIVEEEKILPGTVLKNKREELGLSQKQVADRLRLKLSLIRDIEENNFATGQVATFTRGYLRSYAKVVGLEESVVLGALDDQGTGKPQTQNMTSFSRKTKRDKHDNRIMNITWVILLVIVGISSIWWWQNQQRDTLSPLHKGTEEVAKPSLEAPNQSAPADKTNFTTLESGQLSSQPQGEVSSSDEKSAPKAATSDTSSTKAAVELTTEASSSPVTDVAETTSPSAQSPDNTNKTIDMVFKADCWLQVRDDTGKVLISGIKKGGQSLKLEGQAPFNVILGAPENVSMTFASEPVDLSRYTAGKVARFSLP